jgi:hypothetical protein
MSGACSCLETTFREAHPHALQCEDPLRFSKGGAAGTVSHAGVQIHSELYGRGGFHLQLHPGGERQP